MQNFPGIFFFNRENVNFLHIFRNCCKKKTYPSKWSIVPYNCKDFPQKTSDINQDWSTELLLSQNYGQLERSCPLLSSKHLLHHPSKKDLKTPKPVWYSKGGVADYISRSRSILQDFPPKAKFLRNEIPKNSTFVPSMLIFKCQ